jgi:hypothetical protein
MMKFSLFKFARLLKLFHNLQEFDLNTNNLQEFQNLHEQLPLVSHCIRFQAQSTKVEAPKLS